VNIAIVGAGKVGSVLGRILADNGEKIVCVVSRTQQSAQRAGKFLRCRNVSTSLAAIPPKTEVIYITTPHQAVEEVAQKLTAIAHLNFSKLFVCHASGMLSSEVLEPLTKKGATVFSFHPLQTFPRDFNVKDIVANAKGIYYAIDGNAKGAKKAQQLAKKMKGKTIYIKPEMRVFYHAACVVAANHLVTMLWILEQMFAELKTKEKDFFPVFEPILKATLKNVEMTSPTKALTGPIARGGVETIAEHFESLQRFAPNLVSYYGSVSAETIRCAEAKGSIDKEQARALYNLIFSNMRM
jgi:predicted short-subunit dehydrogenase-like oxidoreductase (DUF2520 family)